MKYSKDQRDQVVKEYLAGGISMDKLAEKHKMPPATVYAWIRDYRKQTLPKANGTREITNLKNENKRLRDLVVDLMIRGKDVEP